MWMRLSEKNEGVYSKGGVLHVEKNGLQRLESRSDMREPGRFNNTASERVLDLLKSIYLRIW